MKTIIHLASLLMVCVALVSCSTSQTFTVSGLPGTDILTPGQTKLATIGADGKVQVTLSCDSYYPILFSRDATSKDLVPFALEVKRCNYTVARAAHGTAVTLASVGGVALVAGFITTLADDESGAGKAMLVGGGTALLTGAFMGLASNSRLNQTMYSNRIKYLPNQTTNQDLRLTQFVDRGVSKEGSRSTRPSAPSKQLGGTPDDGGSSQDGTDEAEGAKPETPDGSDSNVINSDVIQRLKKKFGKK